MAMPMLTCGTHHMLCIQEMLMLMLMLMLSQQQKTYEYVLRVQGCLQTFKTADARTDENAPVRVQVHYYRRTLESASVSRARLVSSNI